MKKLVLSIFLATSYFISFTQVKYIDIKPDSLLNISVSGTFSDGNGIYLDLDGDTKDDFHFKYEYISGFAGVTWKLQVRCANSNNQVYWKGNTLSNGNHYVKGLNKGDSINKNVLFGVDLGPLLGDYKDQNTIGGNKYIGVRFVSNSKTYYGWILLSSSYSGGTNGNITVKAYAYNTVAGEGINAGDTIIPCKKTTSKTNITACDSVFWNGTTYYSSGTYTYDTLNATGCDSTATLVFFKKTISSALTITACDSFKFNDSVYFQSGTYQQVLDNASTSGCDSTINLNLTINSSTVNTITTAACDSFVLNGKTYKTSGNYTQHLTNTAGCDSTINLNLTINKAASNTITATGCGSYILSGTTYNTSGTYTQTLTNASGCDSIVTLILTINNSSVSNIIEVTCDSFVLNGTTYNASGTYTQTLINSVGCDSTINLSLTINKATSNNITTAGCGSYMLNGTTYNTSGTYTQTLTNAAGCDSVITLVLAIQNVNTSISQFKTQLTATATGVNYQWLDCNTSYSPINGETSAAFTATENGNYAVEITDGNCVDTSNCLAVISVGIENSFPSEVKAYPNPSTGSISLNLGETYTDVEVKVSNLLGKQVYKNTYSTAKEIQLVLNAAPGIYIITISTATHSTNIKVLKQ